MHFDSLSLSSNPRLLYLLQLALRNLKNVHTLRVICGHRNITKALLEGFFNSTRPPSVRRLWLESCSLLGANIDLGALAHGLESIRIRRVRVETAPGLASDQLRLPEYRAARWGQLVSVALGCQGWSTTIVVHEYGYEMNLQPCYTGPDIYPASSQISTMKYADSFLVSHPR